MAVVKSTDLLEPEILADAVLGYISAGVPVMQDTGAARFETGLPDEYAKVGVQVTIPYFGSLGEWEDVAVDGDGLTPAPFASTDEQATVIHTGKAFEITRRAQANGTDPYKEMARQLVGGLRKRLDKGLIETAAANVATAWNPYTFDNQAVGDGKISYDALIEAEALFSDEDSDIAAYVVHPAKYKDLRLIKDGTGRPIFQEPKAGHPATILGVPVFRTASSTLVSGATYKTLILKREAMVAWISDISDKDIQTAVNILTNTDVAAMHVYFAVHRYLRMNGKSLPGVVHLLTL